ncbi:MAG: hypothetical protein FVQ82_08790 [Planctomycetes bacterium]|nr:hypothetical protein [Planctomycetota bacterium]
MFKTIFIILVSVTASAITTAGLLYRYTVPIAPAASAPVASAPVARAVIPPEYAAARPGPVELLDEYVSLQTELPAANPPSSPAKAPVPAPVPQRGFDQQLLMSDISSLSKKLERFNDFLSGELQRLKEGTAKKKQP